MGHEGNPATAQGQANASLEGIFQPDGSIDEAFLSENTGLGLEEAMQEVTFGSYKGTVAQMLADGRCPVGGMISDAFKQGGINGVVQKLDMLRQMDSNFNVPISEATLQREEVKKK